VCYTDYLLPTVNSTNDNIAIEDQVTPIASTSLTSVKSLPKQAREHLAQDAVTATYPANRAEIVTLLNDALATELVCVLRYRSNYFMARGIHTKSVASEFLMHSNEELGHADLIASRIIQLGGEPNFSPDQLTDHSHAEYIIGTTLEEIIKENLVAERIAIDSYRELIHYIGDNDTTTSQMLKTILAVEEEHADELADLLVDLPS
jgi:bacterioferritin